MGVSIIRTAVSAIKSLFGKSEKKDENDEMLDLNPDYYPRYATIYVGAKNIDDELCMKFKCDPASVMVKFSEPDSNDNIRVVFEITAKKDIILDDVPAKIGKAGKIYPYLGDMLDMVKDFGEMPFELSKVKSTAEREPASVIPEDVFLEARRRIRDEEEIEDGDEDDDDNE
jgi:hypothetical protein